MRRRERERQNKKIKFELEVRKRVGEMTSLLGRSLDDVSIDKAVKELELAAATSASSSSPSTASDGGRDSGGGGGGATERVDWEEQWVEDTAAQFTSHFDCREGISAFAKSLNTQRNTAVRHLALRLVNTFFVLLVDSLAHCMLCKADSFIFLVIDALLHFLPFPTFPAWVCDERASARVRDAHARLQPLPLRSTQRT